MAMALGLEPPPLGGGLAEAGAGGTAYPFEAQQRTKRRCALMGSMALGGRLHPRSRSRGSNCARSPLAWGPGYTT